MVNYRIRYTRDGRQQMSAVSYDEPCARKAKARYEAVATDVEIVQVKPGE
ncbi:hypothetical protein ACPCSC_30715 [Streptomyces lavendulocolor]